MPVVVTEPSLTLVASCEYSPGMIQRLGIDVGGVITDRAANDGEDTSFFSGNYLLTTATPGCFDAIASLVRRFGKENVFIVSKCGERIEEKTRNWLRHHRFYEATGFDERNLRFCKSREAKAPICAELGITHFIDDRIDVLTYMSGVVPNRFLFGAVMPNASFPTDIVPVSRWAVVLQAIEIG